MTSKHELPPTPKTVPQILLEFIDTHQQCTSTTEKVRHDENGPIKTTNYNPQTEAELILFSHLDTNTYTACLKDGQVYDPLLESLYMELAVQVIQPESPQNLFHRVL